eukprot:m.33333 g.33333  ORF g.33333 m.33333 type:complete len:687 (-) comp6444_c0_seq1:61-2121(-)
MRVFVNQVDLYTSKVLAKLLASSVPGATKEEEDNFDEGREKNASKYTVVGSLSAPDAVKPSFVSDIVSNEDKHALFEELFKCDVIVYDIAHSESQAQEAEAAVNKLRDHMEEWEGKKTFVCISSVLTWANTKPVDPDDAEAAFQEGDYRKRRTHKNYKSQIDTEKIVYKCGKKTGGKFQSFIIASGVTYGEGEDTFHSVFRQAWELKKAFVPIYGSKDSFLPTIHISDLANVILHVIEGHVEGIKYILAVDEAQSTLGDITNCIAKAMGNSLTKEVDADSAFLMEDMTQVLVDMITLNVKMEMGCIADLPFEWVSREGIVENITKVVAEYKRRRHLEALKICVYGPPASGKTELCNMLTKKYKLPLISRDFILTKTMDMMRASAALLDNHPEDVDIEEAESDKDLLSEIEQAYRETGVYEADHILALFKRQLTSPQCKNHGYVLDAYPLDEETARQLFEPPEPEEEGEGEEDQANDADLDSKMPLFVFALDADDSSLRERVQALSEDEAVASKYSQDNFEEQLQAYHDANTEDNTILNFFDFYDILPKHLDAVENEIDTLLSLAVDVIGQPHNYGPTKEEREEIAKLEAELKEKTDREEARQRAAEDAIEEAQRKGAQALWEARLSEIRAQEREALDQASLPLRTFLMNHVMPTLTQGLMEVCKVKPEDPVDYLAEYLFNNNPQIE